MENRSSAGAQIFAWLIMALIIAAIIGSGGWLLIIFLILQAIFPPVMDAVQALIKMATGKDW